MSCNYKKQQKKRQVNEKRKGLYKEQKRRDWDHKAYHDAPRAMYCALAQ